MGIRGELFSTKVALQNRTYFFNVKENRLGDLYLNIVESKNRDEGGFERQSVILFADDLQEFLGGFDESLRVLEKAVREKRRGPSNKGANRSADRSERDSGEASVPPFDDAPGKPRRERDYPPRDRGSIPRDRDFPPRERRERDFPPRDREWDRDRDKGRDAYRGGNRSSGGYSGGKPFGNSGRSFGRGKPEGARRGREGYRDAEHRSGDRRFDKDREGGPRKKRVVVKKR